jgi:hypothetical protein
MSATQEDQRAARLDARISPAALAASGDDLASRDALAILTLALPGRPAARNV